MLRPMKETPAAYRVEIGANDPISVNPDEFKPEDTSLVRVRDGLFLLRFNGRSIPLHMERGPDRKLRMWTGHQAFDALVRNRRDQLLAAWGFNESSSDASAEVVAPMPGLVLSVGVEPGSEVEPGDPLLVLEAMKMENELRAERAGRIKTVLVAPGDAVSKQQVLIEFEA